MSGKTSIDTKPSDVFKTYPEFSKLTLADRKKYEAFIKDYPPVADTAFSILMMWWNVLDSCAVSSLNGNLIISYWFPGDEKISGLSLIGKNDIDQTICAIFDQMRSRGDKPRLIHVPEYVIEHIAHSELFKIKSERSFDEYILDISKYYPIRSAVSVRRHRIRRFLKNVGDDPVIVKSLDLSNPDNADLLLDFSKQWFGKGIVNATVKSANEAAEFAVKEADMIGIQNACLFVGGELHGYILYTIPADKRYAIFGHAMVNADRPYTFDYMVHAFAEWFSDMGVRYVNIDSDLGLPLVRMLKVTLGPVNYFRKYTIEPASDA